MILNKLKLLLGVLSFIIVTTNMYCQSNNCTTATSITLTSGNACVNGTNAGATTDNILYGSCNSTPVNVVWYTYICNGSNNTFTLSPGTMANPEISIYQGGCPSSTTGTLQTCATATGSTNIYTNWGMTSGTQVWIGIASTSLNDGTFQLCVNSQSPASTPGSTCSQAINICGDYTVSVMTPNSSGQVATCFGSAPQRDIWLKFTAAQSGLLAWTATPTVTTTEFDWIVWDITAGCPGTNLCCNYNYAGGSTNGFGMETQLGTVACGTSAVSLNVQKEFSPPVNLTAGQMYAIQISNYDNTSAGFSLSFINSTFVFGCVTDVKHIQTNNTISVFPNPATNEISINSSIELQKIELYDISGQLLWVEKTKENLHSMSLTNFSSGVYFLKLYSEKQLIKNEKLIILK